MSDAVSWVLELNVKDGQLDAFKALAREMSEATQADEPGATNYEWFISEDGKTIHIYERYVDSAALMIHIGNFGEKFAERFLAWADATRWLVYGDPSDEVREAMAGFGVINMARLTGFVR